MSEIRKDPIVNRWVITLDDKTFVPIADSEFSKDVLPEQDDLCPFCPGNEGKTPFSISEVKDKSGKWKVRVIPNNNPYLKVETPMYRKGVGIFDMISGTGANEIFIETPLHNADMDTLAIEQISDVIKSYRSRFLDLKNDTRIEYILIFKNRGIRAGGHLSHLHSQLMALPVIPKNVAEEIDSAKQYYDFKKRCIYCDLVDNEIQMKDRVVKESEYFICITPYASTSPFEMWIVPKQHKSHFSAIDDKEAADLAYVLKDAVYRLNKALNRPAYNYMIHTTPLKMPNLDHYHWHIELLPRIKSIAGFEWGSGFYINPTIPEESAEYLRNI